MDPQKYRYSLLESDQSDPSSLENVSSFEENPKRQKLDPPSDINHSTNSSDSENETLSTQSHSSSHVNLNQEITEALDGLKAVYEANGDRWRALVYKRASDTIREQPRITDIKQVNGLHGIGQSVRDKIEEVIDTGSLQKLEHFHEDPKMQTLHTFANIPWVGPVTAETLYKKGYRSIDDLRERGKHDLTEQQLVGINHYEDLSVKIPREEVAQIEEVVREFAQRILPGTHSVVCGSYLRGLSESSDVDLILTPPQGQGEFGVTFLSQLVSELEECGFLTDHLVLPPGYVEYKEAKQSEVDHQLSSDSRESAQDQQGSQHEEQQQQTVSRGATPDHQQSDTSPTTSSKVIYMGVCKLLNRPDARHRRLDIWTYPRHVYPFALLFFSGPDHFERYCDLLFFDSCYTFGGCWLRRSIRQHAHNLGYKLDDKGLFPINEAGEVIGPSVVCETERDIFEALGVEYKNYDERNVFQNLEITTPKLKGFVKNSSVNCLNASELIKLVRRHSNHSLVYIATNEPSNSTELIALKNVGFKVFSSAGLLNVDSRSLTALVLDAAVMLQSDTFLAWGVSIANDVIEHERMLNGQSYCVAHSSDVVVYPTSTGFVDSTTNTHYSSSNHPHIPFTPLSSFDTSHMAAYEVERRGNYSARHGLGNE
eukprot:gene23242-29446_t